jgi:D-tagatose-1,6-bisphosphate aldolase subunit GatZ/KbaZ
MSDILRDVIARNRAGAAVAIPSVCTAHPVALKAALLLARKKGAPILIEATSNQANQDGGYTGMTPADFADFVSGIAAQAGAGASDYVLGGDHLGPQVWRAGPPDAAMAKARDMMGAYVRAGFTKIHLDCSEGCAGEAAQLDDATAAARAADLAAVCLGAAPHPHDLVFVVGTEVPVPGGARAAHSVEPTRPEAAAATLAAHRRAFERAGIGAAWAQVGGLVVQPGVEFFPMDVHHLPEGADPGFRAVLADWPGLTLEAHSTDYQRPDVPARLAAQGFAILKVGPALTFAWRRAIYALDRLAHVAGWAEGASVPDVMERLMLADPSRWIGHYDGPPDSLRMLRHHGLADRIRYYWPQPEAQSAVAGLMAQLSGRRLPRALLEQAFDAADLDRAMALAALGHDMPEALCLSAVQGALEPYFP